MSETQPDDDVDVDGTRHGTRHGGGDDDDGGKRTTQHKQPLHSSSYSHPSMSLPPPLLHMGADVHEEDDVEEDVATLRLSDVEDGGVEGAGGGGGQPRQAVEGKRSRRASLLGLGASSMFVEHHRGSSSSSASASSTLLRAQSLEQEDDVELGLEELQEGDAESVSEVSSVAAPGDSSVSLPVTLEPPAESIRQQQLPTMPLAFAGAGVVAARQVQPVPLSVGSPSWAVQDNEDFVLGCSLLVAAWREPDGAPGNRDQAIAALKRAASDGHARACYRLAQALLGRRPPARDEAQLWLREAGEQGCALFLRGWLLRQDGQHERAWLLFKRAFPLLYRRSRSILQMHREAISPFLAVASAGGAVAVHSTTSSVSSSSSAGPAAGASGILSPLGMSPRPRLSPRVQLASQQPKARSRRRSRSRRAWKTASPSPSASPSASPSPTGSGDEWSSSSSSSTRLIRSQRRLGRRARSSRPGSAHDSGRNTPTPFSDSPYQKLQASAVARQLWQDDCEEPFQLAQCYEFGLSGRVDLRHAMFWYCVAAGLGHREAPLQLGKVCESLGEFESAAFWYKVALTQQHHQQPGSVPFMRSARAHPQPPPPPPSLPLFSRDGSRSGSAPATPLTPMTPLSPDAPVSSPESSMESVIKHTVLDSMYDAVCGGRIAQLQQLLELNVSSRGTRTHTRPLVAGDLDSPLNRGMPLLFHAIAKRDHKAVRMLLHHGANVNACDGHDRTALDFCALLQSPPYEIVRALLNGHASLNDTTGAALMRASRDPRVWRQLLRHGADASLLVDVCESGQLDEHAMGQALEAVDEYLHELGWRLQQVVLIPPELIEAVRNYVAAPVAWLKDRPLT